MVTLVDRWYGTTIPEHGPGPQHPLHPLYPVPDFIVSPKTIRSIERLDASLTRLIRAFDRLEYVKRQAALHTQVMRQCAGIRRRQQRGSK